jgi:hypothetical protein
MTKMRKITVDVAEDLFASAQAFTGKDASETVIEGLRTLASRHGQQEARKLRGKVKFSMTWQELRGK